MSPLPIVVLGTYFQTTGCEPVPRLKRHLHLSQEFANLLTMGSLQDSLPRSPITFRQGANLPHWRLDDAIYSVTFRLADSLPQAQLRKWRFERDQAIREASTLERSLTEIEMAYYNKIFGDRVEAWLDRGHGSCVLREPEIAAIVRDVLLNKDLADYKLFAWCIMPNHVHAVVHVFPELDLSNILHAWKGVSARRIRDFQGSRGKGPLWQKEPYDHLIRDRDDLANQIRYVLNNPAAAKLRSWPWVGGWSRGIGS